VAANVTLLEAFIARLSERGSPGARDGLAERAGLPELLAEHVRPGGECGANASLKVGCLVAGMTRALTPSTTWACCGTGPL